MAIGNTGTTQFNTTHESKYFVLTGFPHSIESIEKVLNLKIGFQDLEIVLNWAKMYIRYWKSIEILNGKEIWTYLNIILLKAKQFIIYAVLSNV